MEGLKNYSGFEKLMGLIKGGKKAHLRKLRTANNNGWVMLPVEIRLFDGIMKKAFHRLVRQVWSYR